MEKQNMSATAETTVITPQQFLEHWQGHRRVTRRVIEAFPEDKLFTFSVGGMRPFGELALEMISMAEPGMQGITTGKWEPSVNFPPYTKENAPQTKAALLHIWDEVTRLIDTQWPQVSPQRLREVDVAFGLYEQPVFGTLLYFIDNEIHHRGQGYVYLRALGIEPPPFWDRN